MQSREWNTSRQTWLDSEMKWCRCPSNEIVSENSSKPNSWSWLSYGPITDPQADRLLLILVTYKMKLLKIMCVQGLYKGKFETGSAHLKCSVADKHLSPLQTMNFLFSTRLCHLNFLKSICTHNYDSVETKTVPL